MKFPLLLALLSLTAANPLRAADPRPNIVLILADDMGFSDIGCFGSEIPTPHIDRLASEGVRCTQFYNGARCCPTRAALLTGLYAHQAGIGDMIDDYARGARARLDSPAYGTELNARCVTMAEALRAGGYATFMDGKWHVGAGRDAWPDRRGFDRSFVLINGASNYFGWGPQNVPKVPVQPFALDGRPWQPPREGFFTTDAFTDQAVEQIKTRPADRPFFLYLAYNAPHWPLQELPENIAAFRGKYRAGWDAVREARARRQQELFGLDWALSPADRHVKDWEKLGPKQRDEWDERMAIYAAQIAHMDRAVGRVLDTLRETGADGNTLVVFLTDNGGCAEKIDGGEPDAMMGTRESYTSYRQAWANVSNTPFRMFKRWVHEGGISTPLLARWPQGLKPGATTAQTGHVIDLLPTFLEAAGVRYPQALDGRQITPAAGVSFLPALRGENLAPRPLFWEHEGNRAVHEGDWKLVASFREPWELYNLKTDRSEGHNLAGEQPERVRTLAAEYDAWAQRCGVRPWELTTEKGDHPAVPVDEKAVGAD